MKAIDQKLIALLKKNARISTSDLARQLDLSRSTIQSKIKRLEQEGIIKGYTLVYGDEYENRLVTAHVLIKVVQKLTEKTNRELSNMPEIWALHAISGDFDLIATIKTETTQALSRTLDEISNLQGVERTNSSLILETKFNR